MTHLLDTNTCVEYLRDRVGGPITAKVQTAAPGSIVLCSVVVGELLFGAYHSKRVAISLAEVRAFCHLYSSLPFDDSAADEYGRLRAQLTTSGMLIGPNDLLIASIALANGLTLVTHNTVEFSRVPNLVIEDWQIP